MPNNLITRKMPTVQSSYDAEKHTMRAVIAADGPVPMWDWEHGDHDEVLIADGAEINGRQVPLLDSHMRYSIDSMLGSIRDLETKDCQVLGTLCFDSTPEGQRAETKCREGHLTDLSAGYERLETTWIPKDESAVVAGRTFKGPLRVTPKWRVIEGSLTPVGADPDSKTRSVRIDDGTRKILIERGMKKDATEDEAVRFLESEIKRPNQNNSGKDLPMPEIITLTAEDIGKATTRERERIAHINAMAAIHANNIRPDDQFKDMEALRKMAIDKEWPKEQFNDEVLKRFNQAKPAQTTDVDVSTQGNIGMSEKELKRYSVVRALKLIGNQRALDGIEKEVNDAVAKICKRDDIGEMGFRIPNDIVVQKRALSTTDQTKGGYTVDTEVLGTSLIELLRNQTLVAALGARQLSGLTGNIAIPRQSGGATAYWLSSNGAVTASDQAFAQLGLAPHRLVADTAYDKELLNQSSISIEAFVREDLMRVLAIEKDRAALFGLGSAGQPLGIVNVSGIGSVTFSAAATWAKIVSFETAVAQANALLGAPAYLTSPAVRGKWKTATKIAASQYSSFLWDTGVNGSGLVNGYRAEATNQILSTGTYADRVIFGNWQDLILADWAGIDVVVNPYTLAKQGQIEVTITLWTDNGVRHAASFAISSDSGAQ